MISVPKIRGSLNPLDFPTELLPHNEWFYARAVSASRNHSPVTGRSYVTIKFEILDEGRFKSRDVWYTYGSFQVLHGLHPYLPTTDEEVDTFKPMDLYIKVRRHEFKDTTVNVITRVKETKP